MAAVVSRQPRLCLGGYKYMDGRKRSQWMWSKQSIHHDLAYANSCAKMTHLLVIISRVSTSVPAL
ncbi:hypothetical protein E2C01_041499 [Portunus trituberculatus]|uniref:Uncharacterized protein n=1 Tax=Portunus trituberculatus TaxID=210409 RepID=A0A5B7FRV0_PORTR|nr:hypothetical protein [Portunus trituberculatus]